MASVSILRRVRPLRFVAHERLPNNISFSLWVRDVFTRVLTFSCSVQYSVDKLYRCTLGTGSEKDEQLSKVLLHTHT